MRLKKRSSPAVASYASTVSALVSALLPGPEAIRLKIHARFSFRYRAKYHILDNAFHFPF